MPHGKICYLEIPANRAEDSARFYSDISAGRCVNAAMGTWHSMTPGV